MKLETKQAVLAALLAAGWAVGPLSAGEPEGKPTASSIPLGEKTPKSAYAGLAKISLKQALETGLKQQPGTPIRAELKKDDGFLVYEVEITSKENKTYEITLDPGTGKVLETELEGNEKEDADD